MGLEEHCLPHALIGKSSKGHPNLLPYLLSQGLPLEAIPKAARILQPALAWTRANLEQIWSRTPDQVARDTKEGFLPEIQLYTLTWGTLKQHLPIGVTSWAGTTEQTIKALPWIPAIEPEGQNEWKLGYSVTSHDDNGWGYLRGNNWMEHRKEGSAAYKQWWLHPFFEKGLTLTPETWNLYVKFHQWKAGEERGQGYRWSDEVTLNVECRQMKEGLWINGIKGCTINRNPLMAEESQFKQEVRLVYNKNKETFELENKLKEYRFKETTLHRITKGATASTELVNPEQLLLAEIFPRMNHGRARVDEQKTVQNITAIYQGTSKEELAGLGWVAFH